MKNIDDLIRKFWKGTSKIDEEQELKKHFNRNEKLQVEDEFFSYLENKRNQKLNTPDFNEEILRKIKGEKDVKKSIFQKINWQVAATIVILFTVGTIYLSRQDNTDPNDSSNQLVFVDTYEDPQIAFEETKKALLMISSKLNKGNAYTTEIAKFNQSQEILRKEK